MPPNNNIEECDFNIAQNYISIQTKLNSFKHLQTNKFKALLLGPSSMTNLEIRMGFESPDNGNPHLLNHFYGSIKSVYDFDGNTTFSESYNQNPEVPFDSYNVVEYTILCGAQCRTGSFITIQKLGCGQLDLTEVFVFPYPGKDLSSVTFWS